MPSRLNWRPEEENLLKTLKEEENIQSWKKIAQILNEKFPDSSRSGKQCRDRYINYVRFNSKCPKIVGWTSQEDRTLFEKFYQHGAKWVHISKQMPGRSENNLKNRFYGAMRKIMRKIVKVQKEIKPKPKKSIKEKQLIRVFEECRCADEVEIYSGQVENFTKFTNQLYNKLLVLAVSQQEEIGYDQVKNVIELIHTYNSLITKTISKRKSDSETSITGYSSKENMIEEASTLNFSQNVPQKKEDSLPMYEEIDYQAAENSFLSWQLPFDTLKQNFKQDISDFFTFEDELLEEFEKPLNNFNSEVQYSIY